MDHKVRVSYDLRNLQKKAYSVNVTVRILAQCNLLKTFVTSTARTKFVSGAMCSSVMSLSLFM